MSGRPWVSRIVVTTPAGLLTAKYLALGSRLSRTPRRLTMSCSTSTLSPSVATLPLTVTLPAAISSSPCRRDPSPALASALWRRSSATSELLRRSSTASSTITGSSSSASATRSAASVTSAAGSSKGASEGSEASDGKPRRSRKRGVVAYRSGRPGPSSRPASSSRPRSTSARRTPSEFTPRIALT